MKSFLEVAARVKLSEAHYAARRTPHAACRAGAVAGMATRVIPWNAGHHPPWSGEWHVRGRGHPKAVEQVDETIFFRQSGVATCPLAFGEFALKLEFHHINYVSRDVEALQSFYINILKMEPIAPQNFPRTTATEDAGYDGNIKFATEGSMQMHLAERDLDVAVKNGQHINPVERGHIAFRTDDIEGFMQHLRDNDIAFADYGTAFAAEWHQIFFYDPEGNIIEVHQQVG